MLHRFKYPIMRDVYIRQNLLKTNICNDRKYRTARNNSKRKRKKKENPKQMHTVAFQRNLDQLLLSPAVTQKFQSLTLLRKNKKS